MNIIFIGPPGSGKGTQSDILKNKYNLVHITTGGLFRDIIKSNGTLAKEISSYIDYGNLVPDHITKEIMSMEIGKHKNPGGFIIDGFPRTVSQLDMLNDLIAEHNLSQPTVIGFQLDDQSIKNRLAERAVFEGRIDDADEDSVNKRLAIYKEQSSILLEKFETYNILDANDTIENITNKIESILNEKAG